MSEDRANEPTEEPTGKRRQDFRDEGKIPQSRDVSAVLLLAVSVGGFALAGGTMTQIGLGSVLQILRRIGDVPTSPTSAIHQSLADAGLVVAILAGATGVALAAVAAAAGLIQTGGLFSAKLLKFDLSRIQLLAGLKRSLASSEAVTNVLLALGKASAIAFALGIVLRDEVPRLPALVSMSVEAGLAYIGHVLLKVAIAALLITAVMAAIDWILSARRIGEQMKMTKQEVKDEHKQQEGDPAVRGRMRQRMRTLGRNRMLADTRKADVVVVNPTHYAVALTYSQGQAGAPRLVAKGVDHLAGKIREIARKHGVPIVANPPVARAVYATTKVGREIPPELYEVVARVLAYVYRMTQWRRSA